MTNLQTVPGGPIASSVGTEGRVSTAINYGPQLQIAAEAVKAGFTLYKKDVVGKAALSDLNLASDALAPPAAADESFGPVSEVQTVVQKIQDSESVQLNDREKQVLQQAVNVRKSLDEARRQGVDPGNLDIRRLTNLRDMVASHPYLAPEIISIVNANSPMINDIEASLVKASKAEVDRQNATLEDMRKQLTDEGWGPQVLQVSTAQLPLLYERVKGGAARELTAAQQVLSKINMDNSIGDAEKKKRVLEVAEPAADSLVAVQSGAAAGILTQVKSGTWTRERGVAEMLDLRARYEREARSALRYAGDGDFDRLVGWHLKQVDRWVERLKGNDELQAIQNDVSIAVNTATRKMITDSPDMKNALVLTEKFGNLFQDPTTAATLSGVVADAIENQFKVKSHTTPPGLGTRNDPATGRSIDPVVDGKRHGQLIQHLSDNVGRVGFEEAEVVVSDVSAIFRSKSTRSSYVAIAPVIAGMAGSNYAQVVQKSRVSDDRIGDGQSLAKEYLTKVEQIIETQVGPIDGKQIALRRLDSGLFELIPGPEWTGDRQKRDALRGYGSQVVAGVRAYAHASGSTDYNGAVTSLFGTK